MKKLIHEVIVIFVLVFAMYLISSAGVLEDSSGAKQSGKALGTHKTKSTSEQSKEEHQFDQLKKAKESLTLYRLYKKNKLIKPVIICIQDHMIDINTASAYALTLFKGVGKALSKRIVEYRLEHGIFYDVNDLVKVKGIGKKKLEKILHQKEAS